MNTHSFNAILMNPDDDVVVRSRSNILSKKMLDNAKDVFADLSIKGEARTRSRIFAEPLKKSMAEAEAEAEDEAQALERLLKLYSQARQARR